MEIPDDKILYKIRIFTYSNGYHDEVFYALNDEQAEEIANEISFICENSWFWSWL